MYRKSYKGKITVKSEVAHFKGIGKYASDAWRVFCKDDLYRKAGFPVSEPEWTKVCPQDKELCAYLQWKRTVSGKPLLNETCQETEALSACVEKLSLGDSVSDVTLWRKMVSVTFKDKEHISVPAKILLRAEELRSDS